METTAAKEFLISRIIEESKLEHVHLSDVEKKMLYFTETQRTLPDMAEVVAEFEQKCNSDDYERKIIGLLKNARIRELAPSAQQMEMWNDAISTLKQEDHYLLVLIYCAFPDYRKAILPTHRMRDYMIYIAIGIAVVCLAIGVALWRQ
jgi:hypothetical protein